MYDTIDRKVFPFIKELRTEGSTYSSHMKDARFTIPTPGLLVGTREDFERVYGKQESLGLFIRKLVGLDREAAKRAFGEYLTEKTLTANQIQFINLIIDYLTENGIMDPGILYASPYTDYSPQGLDGVFSDPDAGKIVDILSRIKKNAAA